MKHCYKMVDHCRDSLMAELAEFEAEKAIRMAEAKAAGMSGMVWKRPGQNKGLDCGIPGGILEASMGNVLNGKEIDHSVRAGQGVADIVFRYTDEQGKRHQISVECKTAQFAVTLYNGKGQRKAVFSEKEETAIAIERTIAISKGSMVVYVEKMTKAVIRRIARGDFSDCVLTTKADFLRVVRPYLTGKPNVGGQTFKVGLNRVAPSMVEELKGVRKDWAETFGPALRK